MVTTEAEPMEELQRSKPGLLIVTPNLEEGDGLALAKRARSMVPDIRSLITTLSLGRRYRSPAMLACIKGEDQGWRNAMPPLSDREQQLIDLWVEGLGDREVADRLGLS